MRPTCTTLLSLLALLAFLFDSLRVNTVEQQVVTGGQEYGVDDTYNCTQPAGNFNCVYAFQIKKCLCLPKPWLDTCASCDVLGPSTKQDFQNLLAASAPLALPSSIESWILDACYDGWCGPGYPPPSEDG